MVYTPKLVSQKKSYLGNDVKSPPPYQGSESFNSSSQWLRRRFEQSQENSFASDFDQSSPLQMYGKGDNILASKARSTGFQTFNTLSPMFEQVSSPTSPTSLTPPITPQTTPQLQGFGEQSRTFRSVQFQPRPEINATGSTIRSIHNTAQQDNSSSISFAPTPQTQNTTPFYQSQSSAYVPITQSQSSSVPINTINTINTPVYTSPVRTSDSTFNVLSNRFERNSSIRGQNLIGRGISDVNARIVESPLIQSTPAPKPRHQQTPPHKVEKVPYLARLLMIEQELPKNEYEVEKSNSVKTLFFNICLGIFITFLTSTKYFRRFENYYVNIIGYCMFCIPAFYILRVLYTYIRWARKKKQIDQLKEELMKELEQNNNSYDASNFTISPPRPTKSTRSTIFTPSTITSSIPIQSTTSTISTTLPSTSTSMINSTSTIIPPASSSSSSFVNAWGSPSGASPFPQRVPPTTKYRQAPYVTPSRIDENLITIGNISARLPPEPKPTDRET